MQQQLQEQQRKHDPLLPQLPLLDSVHERGQRQHEAPFHVPGHKRGAGAPPQLAALLGQEALRCDLTELDGEQGLCPCRRCIFKLLGM